MDPSDYCRQIEAYLTRKNDGHLVRIVGPAFERVRAWAERGVPLKIAFEGIDRYFERYYARGPRRRPVRIEFCEADVLDAFDDWRRAVGLGTGTTPAGGERGSDAAPGTGRRRLGLGTHVDRVIARLTEARTAGAVPPALETLCGAVVRELDTLRADARAARGPARQGLIERLAALDGSLIDAALAACDDVSLDVIRAEADGELEPFRERMPASTFAEAHARLVRRLVRTRFNLPLVSFE